MFDYVRNYNDNRPAGKTRFFLKYSSKLAPSKEEGSFMVYAEKDGPMMQRVSSLSRHPPEIEHHISKSSKTLPVILASAIRSMAEQRFDALRDDSLMAKSLRYEDMARVEALSRVERKLANYRSALIQHAQLAQFEDPSTRGLTSLRHWFWVQDKKREKLELLPLQGLARDIYSQKDRIDDLVAVGPPSRHDKLSYLIDFVFASKLKKKGDPPMQGLGEEAFFYSEAWVESIVSWVGIVLATGLLVGAMVGLDQLDDKDARMGTICAHCRICARAVFHDDVDEGRDIWC